MTVWLREVTALLRGGLSGHSGFSLRTHTAQAVAGGSCNKTPNRNTASLSFSLQ